MSGRFHAAALHDARTVKLHGHAVDAVRGKRARQQLGVHRPELRLFAHGALHQLLLKRRQAVESRRDDTVNGQPVDVTAGSVQRCVLLLRRHCAARAIFCVVLAAGVLHPLFLL